jgi:hypothetical protein
MSVWAGIALLLVLDVSTLQFALAAFTTLRARRADRLDVFAAELKAWKVEHRADRAGRVDAWASYAPNIQETAWRTYLPNIVHLAFVSGT